MIKPQALEEPSKETVPDAPEWRISGRPVPYEEAVREMEERAGAIAEGRARELVWLLEHPALYTAGTSADARDLIDPKRFPVFKTGRGGQYTYHGPGQRVAYVMLDLKRRKPDVRAFVTDLERWLSATLATFNVTGEVRGDRIRKWVTFHGVSLNVDPDLDHFTGIVPCGISQFGVTSLADLGVSASMSDVDTALRATFGQVFQK